MFNTGKKSERGWGCRDDGASLHLSVEDCEAYCKKYWDEETASNKKRGGGVPGCYSRECGGPCLMDTNESTYKKLKKLKKNNIFGLQVFNLDEYKTKAEQEKIKIEKENKVKAIDIENQRRNDLKKNALAKLSEEEKQILGLHLIYGPTKPDPNRGWR